MLILKNQTVIDCLQLLEIEACDEEKNDVISEKLHFHFLGEYSKHDRVKTMGTREKINVI